MTDFWLTSELWLTDESRRIFLPAGYRAFRTAHEVKYDTLHCNNSIAKLRQPAAQGDIK